MQCITIHQVLYKLKNMIKHVWLDFNKYVYIFGILLIPLGITKIRTKTKTLKKRQ